VQNRTARQEQQRNKQRSRAGRTVGIAVAFALAGDLLLSLARALRLGLALALALVVAAVGLVLLIGLIGGSLALALRALALALAFALLLLRVRVLDASALLGQIGCIRLLSVARVLVSALREQQQAQRFCKRSVRSVKDSGDTYLALRRHERIAIGLVLAAGRACPRPLLSGQGLAVEGAPLAQHFALSGHVPGLVVHKRRQVRRRGRALQVHRNGQRVSDVRGDRTARAVRETEPYRRIGVDWEQSARVERVIDPLRLHVAAAGRAGLGGQRPVHNVVRDGRVGQLGSGEQVRAQGHAAGRQNHELQRVQRGLQANTEQGRMKRQNKNGPSSAACHCTSRFNKKTLPSNRLLSRISANSAGLCNQNQRRTKLKV
jgi:hypothetical protein